MQLCLTFSQNFTITEAAGTVINISGIARDNSSISGISAKCSFPLNITLKRADVLNFSIRVNDTANNFATTSTIITIIDTLGTVVIGENLTAVRITDIINTSINISEPDDDIGFCVASHNLSGIHVNTSFKGSGSNFNCSQAFEINLTRGNVVNFTRYYNDTVGTTVQDSTKFTIQDNLGVILLGTNLTTIRKNDVINISANITEPDRDIEFCMIGSNQSGAHVNTTFEGSGSKFNCSQSTEITLDVGGVINFTVFGNDSAGTLIQNSLKLTVISEDADPPIINLISPGNNTVITANAPITHTFTFNTSETSSCNLYFNGISKDNESGLAADTPLIFNGITGIQAIIWSVNCSDVC